MGDLATKREREKQVVSQMIALYCRKKHRGKKQLCPTKTFCSNCRVHCYRPDMREQIRQVMRFSGPRMLCCHPVMATRHVIETQREKRKLEGQHEV